MNLTQILDKNSRFFKKLHTLFKISTQYLSDSMTITIEQTLEAQRDLAELCRDRQLTTNEIFEPNCYYGSDFILKKYTGMPSKQPLKIVLPHGIELSGSYLSQAEKNALLPVIHYYSPHRKFVAENKMRFVAMAGAAPFVYLQALLEGHPKPQRKGTIFFPLHSTHHVTSKMDFIAIANHLLQWDDEYKPITICIYWRDYNLGHHKEFQKKGFRIVSAGHMYDPHFLFRIHHLCSMHKYAASNEVGSHLFYSVKTGCSYFHLNHLEGAKIPLNKKAQKDISHSKAERTKLASVFSDPRKQMTQKQLNLVDSYLGVKNVKPPDKLRAELLFADKLDRFGVAKHYPTNKYYFAMPNLYPRIFLRKAKRKFSSLFTR